MSKQLIEQLAKEHVFQVDIGSPIGIIDCVMLSDVETIFKAYQSAAPIDNVAEALEKAAAFCVQPYPNDNEYQQGWNDAEAHIEKCIRSLIPDTQAKKGE
jgi:hypothetical protein